MIFLSDSYILLIVSFQQITIVNTDKLETFTKTIIHTSLRNFSEQCNRQMYVFTPPFANHSQEERTMTLQEQERDKTVLEDLINFV